MEKRDNIKEPLVSVILATFNEPPAMLTKSMRSILDQTYSNLELLVADDSTNAETRHVIDNIAASDTRVRVIRKDKRMGFVNALNEAIKASKGTLLARMDGDDISLPDRIQLQVEYATKNPDIDIFGGDMYIMDANDNIISERHYPTTPKKIKMMFLYRSPFSHPTLMFRKKIADEGLLYNPEYKKAEDIDFYMRLFKQGYKFGNTGEYLLKYRVVGDLQKKRPKDQWIYNHKARKENFIWSKPVFSSMSYTISLIYKHIPNAVVSSFYKRENKKSLKQK